LGAAVYSQAGQPCPPRFAFGFAWRSHALSRRRSVPGVARRAKTGRRRPPSTTRQHPKTRKYPLVGAASVLVLVAGDRVGIRQPAVQVDIPAALGAERLGGLGGRFALAG